MLPDILPSEIQPANVCLKVECVRVEMLTLLKCVVEGLYGEDRRQTDLLTLLQGPPPEQHIKYKVVSVFNLNS